MSRFQRLYRENFPFVWAAAHRCGAPSHAVDDVVQDVFVTAYRRIDELYFEVSPRGWLYGVTRRIAFRYRRSAARSARRRAAFGREASASTQPHAQHDAMRDLEALLGQVDEAQRETFVMAELLGMSGPEIAGELRIPLDTVYSRLRLARRRLSRLAGSAERLHAGVVHACKAQAPTPRQQARTWAAIVPALASKAIALPLLSLGTVKAAWLPLSIVAVAATVLVLRSDLAPARAAAPTRDAPEIAEGRRADPSRAVADRDDAGFGATARPDSGEPAAPVSAEIVEVSTGAPAAATGVSPTTTRASAGVRPVAAPSGRAGDSAGELTEELAILDRASAAASAGELARALEVLGEHARRFPHGQLEEARRATRVQVLCDLGRTDAARQEAAALHRDHPGSAVAARTTKTCAPP